MSRSGYSEDCGGWELIRYRGMVASSIRGKRGQKFLCSLRDALDALPTKKLITDELEDANGSFCAMGVIVAARGLDARAMDIDDPPDIAEKLDVASPLVREIIYENDEGSYYNETPEGRWQRMRRWVDTLIK